MNKPISQMSRCELIAEMNELTAEYEKIKAAGLSLDMSRGKPCKEQLDLSDSELEVITAGGQLRHLQKQLKEMEQ